MIEPMFGTAPSPWPGFSPSGFGWPVPAGSRSLPNGPLFSAPPLPPLVGAVAGMPPRGAFAALTPEPYNVTPFPTVLPPDVIGGYSVPALLSAVAMRRGQPLGPTNDQEIEDFVYDALEMLPGTNEVEVRCEGGRITLTGSVPHKRIKRDVGEIAWGIPIVNDVQNSLTIATKRRARPTQREGEPTQGQPSRKQG
jgi:BON domain